MGNLCSAPQSAQEREATKQDKRIQAKNRADVEAEHRKIKLLLLGAGESGKSAIFKQMKLIYGQPPSVEELSMTRQVIHSNIVEFIKVLCEGVKVLKLEQHLLAKSEFDAVLAMDNRFALTNPLDPLSVSLGDAIKILWHDPAIKMVWEERSLFQAVDSHAKFLDDIDRIKADNFQPTAQDNVLARVRTTGMVAEHLVIENNTFALYDVGGQRSERRKWIHVFDNVTSVIFVAALSEYDQTLFEDNTKNRMVEAIELFDWIANHELFLKKSIILFLNKMDLMKPKLMKRRVHTIDLWSDCPKDGDDVESRFDTAWKYFYAKFYTVGTRTNPVRDIYAHVTCATDPANVEHVFNACKSSILKTNLAEYGVI